MFLSTEKITTNCDIAIIIAVLNFICFAKNHIYISNLNEIGIKFNLGSIALNVSKILYAIFLIKTQKKLFIPS